MTDNIPSPGHNLEEVAQTISARAVPRRLVVSSSRFQGSRVGYESRKYKCIYYDNQTDQAGEGHAVLEDDLEDLGLSADLLGCGTRDDDRLCVDHFPHDAPARIGCGHQDRADAEPLGRDLLKVTEEHIRTRIGARQGHPQPSQQGPEEGEGRAGPSQAQTEDCIHP